MIKKVGIAGCGALGSIVAKALSEGVDGYVLAGISDIKPAPFDVPMMSFDELAQACDIIVECLPAKEVPALAQSVLHRGKVMIVISSAALMIYPEILTLAEGAPGRIVVPSGAIAGLDAVMALNCADIDTATIASTKPPKGFTGAPYVMQKGINLTDMTEKTLIFGGSALEAAKAFPANVNVAATLSLAGIGPNKTRVEVWADPSAAGNSHEITVVGKGSTITTKVHNLPDPVNPKSSMLAGYSIIACLKKLNQRVTVM